MLDWFSGAIESIDQFANYEQLQLLICAHALGVSHPNVTAKVTEFSQREEADSLDYVHEFLEQLVFITYDTARSRQERYFNYWITEEQYLTHNDLTQAYHLGYLLMDGNKLSTPEWRQKAIQWLKETTFLPSMSFTAWTVHYLERNNELGEARRRFDELIALRMENGSWNNYPLQTIQIAYPLSLTSFGNHELMKVTDDFIRSQPWEGYSGDIKYETGLLKWLNSKGLLAS